MEYPNELASRVRAGDRVVDLGAGQQFLRTVLPDGCEYIPIDLHPWSPDTLVCDLNNAATLPDLDADWVIGSGVMEYLHDVPRILAWIKNTAPNVALSYRTADGHRFTRRSLGWVNDYSEADLQSLAANTGLRVVDSKRFGYDTLFWLTSML